MSGALARFGRRGFSFAKLPAGGVLNASGSAGPRRLMVFVLILLGLVVLVVVVATTGTQAPVLSRDARMKRVDPLPGGLYSTPEQDALAIKANTAQANAALNKGVSFTPPMAPSEPALPPPPRVEQAALHPPERHQPIFVGRPAALAVPAPLQAVFPVPLPPEAAQPRPIPVAATIDPAMQQAYTKRIDDLFSQWSGRVPRTDVVLPPSEPDGSEGGHASAQHRNGSRDAVSPVPASAHATDPGEVLIPAGRGVYAHPVLALNSDASSPVVLQADSGPIAGDRMIGTFARQDERLVIHVSTVVHDGQTIGADGVVIAPDTMEAAVASNVDQHYLTRFLLPAAAAFVQGLGQAIATTSNSVAVLSPFGGATTATNLNFRQQLGVAAGTAGGQIGATLNQAVPKGPTVTLDANVAVGVMFLSNVTVHRGL